MEITWIEDQTIRWAFQHLQPGEFKASMVTLAYVVSSCREGIILHLEDASALAFHGIRQHNNCLAMPMANYCLYHPIHHCLYHSMRWCNDIDETINNLMNEHNSQKLMPTTQRKESVIWKRFWQSRTMLNDTSRKRDAIVVLTKGDLTSC